MKLKRRSFLRKQQKETHINIAPFVDVLFVMLIVFMIAAPIMLGGVKIDLPKGTADLVVVKKEPISVTIAKDGSIYLGKDAIKLRLLPNKLLEITRGNLETRIFVRADEKLNYGRVVKVVGRINSAGFINVSLVTDLAKNL